jgi:hypothetical protein
VPVKIPVIKLILYPVKLINGSPNCWKNLSCNPVISKLVEVPLTKLYLSPGITLITGFFSE